MDHAYCEIRALVERYADAGRSAASRASGGPTRGPVAATVFERWLIPLRRSGSVTSADGSRRYRWLLTLVAIRVLEPVADTGIGVDRRELCG
jgi:hypothetical protein